MTRAETRSLTLALGAAAVSLLSLGLTTAPPASTAPRPRLLVSERDPFTGLPELRLRWSRGERPADDLPGRALSYLLSGDEAYARAAVDEMRRSALPQRTPSRDFRTYAEWAMAFDWVYASATFDTALKDRIAGELVARAATILALPSLRDPGQASYHNHTLRELALATFALAAVEGHASVDERARPLREHADQALDNVLELTDLVNPDGAYHESTDYMRITWEPLAMLAELRRTRGAVDPAHRFPVFRNMGTTYLYKALPDGSMARDDDNEYPHLDGRDSLVLGYAVHRFQDPYAAYLLRESGWLPPKWSTPVLEFLWRNDKVAPRDPAKTTESELPRRRLFRGVSHLVLRDGFGPESTWVQLSAGPYLAKHDHLDWGHFAIYHRGHLAIDAGADYTDTESPHYLNHYRRTVAHNTLLVYQKGERFFWGANKWDAANDGGQRMDSARFWNTVRSLADWRQTRDLWDRGSISTFESVPGAFDYARGDGTRAYSPAKLERLVREVLYLPRADVLFVLDRVRATEAHARKVWLLHGVAAPKVEGTARAVGNGGTSYGASSLATLEDGSGRLRLHPVLPVERDLLARGGPGFEFWTPGDEYGGEWGSGKNWPLEPPEGGPLPSDPYLKKMWLTFWGEDMKAIAPSNRRAVVPGSWRIEISPLRPSHEDVFLNVLEIGDVGVAPRSIERILGYRMAGAAVAGDAAVLSTTAVDVAEAEANVPDLETTALLVTGLAPRSLYELQLTSASAPGSPGWRLTAEATEAGLVHAPWKERDGRLRLRRLRR
jgi:hypothetical protein